MKHGYKMLYQWTGLRENLQETFPVNMGFSCKFSLTPIHIRQIPLAFTAFNTGFKNEARISQRPALQAQEASVMGFHHASKAH